MKFKVLFARQPYSSCLLTSSILAWVIFHIARWPHFLTFGHTFFFYLEKSPLPEKGKPSSAAIFLLPPDSFHTVNIVLLISQALARETILYWGPTMCQALCCGLHQLPKSDLTVSPWSRYCYDPYITTVETEAKHLVQGCICIWIYIQNSQV